MRSGVGPPVNLPQEQTRRTVMAHVRLEATFFLNQVKMINVPILCRALGFLQGI
jgi:hypothetical protein